MLLLLRLPFVSPALDNTDSVNFDLGVHDYDPGLFQPHPPGYPVYILLAKVSHGLFAAHGMALGILSAILGAATVVPLYVLMRRLLQDSGAARSAAAIACLLTLFNPTLWFNSVRPMSDMTALFFITTAQCLLVAAHLDDGAPSRRRQLLWLVGTAVAGLSSGVRLQAIWCVGPLLVYGFWRFRPLRMATALVFTAAVAAWIIPMLVLSGGLTRYSHSLAALIGGALPGEPLFSRLTLNHAATRAVDVLLTPWQDRYFGSAILSLAGAGALMLLARNRRLLAMVSLLFAPYAVYHYLLQDTTAIRYTIPIIPAVSLLACVPIVVAARRVPLVTPVAGATIAIVAAVFTVPALAAYHSTPSPSHLALAAVDRFDPTDDFLLSGQSVFERYLNAVNDHEVLRPTEGARRTLLAYWKNGGRKPVLFMRDPQRMALLFFGRDGQQSLGRWAWAPSVRPFMKGERPGDVELVRLTAPRWLTESGLLVSPEAGPIEKVVAEKHLFHVRASPNREALLVSGFLNRKGSARMSLKVGHRLHREWNVRRHFTLRTMIDPLSGPGGYVPLTIETTESAVFTDVWLEPEGRPLIRLSDGFSPPERDEQANLFRWIGPQARATAYLPGRPGRLTIEGVVPIDYYRPPFRLSLEWNGGPLAPVDVTTSSFRIERVLHGSDEQPWGELTLRASQSFVPDARQHNGDRRTLSVRIYGLTLE